MNRILTVAILMILTLSSTAMAYWSQTFYEDGSNGLYDNFSFDAFAIKLVVGNFEMPTISINDVSWSVVWEDPTTVAASGDVHTPGDLLYLTLNFAGNHNSQLLFDYVAYYGDSIVQSQRAQWSGCNWTIGAFGSGKWLPERNDIPEPSTVAILTFATCLSTAFRKSTKHF